MKFNLLNLILLFPFCLLAANSRAQLSPLLAEASVVALRDVQAGSAKITKLGGFAIRTKKDQLRFTVTPSEQSGTAFEKKSSVKELGYEVTKIEAAGHLCSFYSEERPEVRNLALGEDGEWEILPVKTKAKFGEPNKKVLIFTLKKKTKEVVAGVPQITVECETQTLTESKIRDQKIGVFVKAFEKAGISLNLQSAMNQSAINSGDFSESGLKPSSSNGASRGDR